MDNLSIRFTWTYHENNVLDLRSRNCYWDFVFRRFLSHFGWLHLQDCLYRNLYMWVNTECFILTSCLPNPLFISCFQKMGWEIWGKRKIVIVAFTIFFSIVYSKLRSRCFFENLTNIRLIYFWFIQDMIGLQ